MLSAKLGFDYSPLSLLGWEDWVVIGFLVMVLVVFWRIVNGR